MSDTTDNLSDAKEFAELSKSFKESSRKSQRPTRVDDLLKYFDEDEVKPGQPVQYALHADGYAPTTATIEKLPAGCYEITQDNTAVFVRPLPPPAGLLLELPEMRSEEVIKTVESFWNSEDDYKLGNEFVIGGSIFKAGSLLYGPQGSGKSTTIKLVSKKIIERDGVVFYASGSPVIVNSFLSNFALIEKNRKCVVVLEDIDTLIENYGESGYLEMLDSAKTINNVFFIATTNYPERLNPRIYCRPGRFSHVIKIGLPTINTRRAYLKAVLKNHKDIDYIVDNSVGFSIDHLSSLCNAVYREKKNLQEEMKRLRILFQTPTVEEKSLGFGLNTGEEND